MKHRMAEGNVNLSCSAFYDKQINWRSIVLEMEEKQFVNSGAQELRGSVARFILRDRR